MIPPQLSITRGKTTAVKLNLYTNPLTETVRMWAETGAATRWEAAPGMFFAGKIRR